MKRPEQDKLDEKQRLKSFDEVNLGLSEEQAVAEAKRCLKCKNAECVKGCPAGIDIPGFVSKLSEGDFNSAVKILRDNNPLPSVCGRICPQDKNCELKCILQKAGDPIAISLLERFVGDLEFKGYKKEKNNKKKVAVVGSGPSGLAAAYELQKLGYNVTVYEALHEFGGVLNYGVPSFRLPKEMVMKEIERIEDMGVVFLKNHVIGRAITLEELQKKFDAIYVATGAGVPRFMGVEGESLSGVYSANEYLTRINLMKSNTFPKVHTPMKRHKKTIVVGGGNVAMDAARAARRMGAEVTILYRRSLDDMPARKEEIDNAQKEGINFLMMTTPKRILGTEKVEGMECIQMMMEIDEFSGKNIPVRIDGTEFEIECDSVIVAIGQHPNKVISSTHDIKTASSGALVVDERFRTSFEKVYAGGDVIGGDTTVTTAIGEGKKAAHFIHSYIGGDEQRELENF